MERADGSLMAISTKFLFGCDGSAQCGSACKERTTPQLQHSSRLSPKRHPVAWYSKQCYTTPHMHWTLLNIIQGRTGYAVSMLPYTGKAGQPRPLSFAQLPGHLFHNLHTADKVYDMLDSEFPPMEARQTAAIVRFSYCVHFSRLYLSQCEVV